MILFRLLFLKEWQINFNSRWLILGEVFGILLSLTIYWYTAKAFSTVNNYFQFVVYGELSLLLPIALFQGFLRNTKNLVTNGILEHLLMLPQGGLKPMISIGTTTLAREIGRIFLTLLIGHLLFGLKTSPLGLFGFFLVQLLALPLFLGLGICASAIFIAFGRGESIVSAICSVATILSGVYFPTTVFPDLIQVLLRNLSPFNLVVEVARANLTKGLVYSELFAPIAAIGLWSLLCFTLGIFLFKWSTQQYHSRGGLFPIR